ncbi:ion channel [Kaarinaea lacus]
MTKTQLQRLIAKSRFQFLLTFLLLLLTVVPFLKISALSDIVITILFFVALLAFAERRALLFLCMILVVVGHGCGWGAYWTGSQTLIVISKLLDIALILLVSGFILNIVFRAREITIETVAGAICVYLFIGIFWADVYALVEIANPGSFSLLKDEAQEAMQVVAHRTSQFNYFSFVTLSTLGYGDITPQTRPAQGLAAMEAILGQLFLAVLIARLVGQVVVRQEEAEKEREKE